LFPCRWGLAADIERRLAFSAVATHDDRTTTNLPTRDYSAAGVSASGGTRGAHHLDADQDFTAHGYTERIAVEEPPNTGFADDDPFDEERRRTRWHGGADFGLLVLRLLLGGTFLAHGSQILFGTFKGPGTEGFARFLDQHGYQNAKVLALLAGSTELGSGALMVLGLLTPVAASAILGVMAHAAATKWSNGFFAANQGFELEVTLAAIAFGLLFIGPGRVALDNGRAWYRHPVASAWIFLLIAAGAAAGVYLAFHGFRGFHLG
jgi:putative oxidoreductase